MVHTLQRGDRGHHAKKEPKDSQTPRHHREEKGAPHPEPTWAREGYDSPNRD